MSSLQSVSSVEHVIQAVVGQLDRQHIAVDCTESGMNVDTNK